MTTIDEGLYGHLTKHSGLTALVAMRIYPDVLPQDCTLPAIAYMVEQEDSDPTQDTDGIRATAYAFVIEGDTAKSVEAVTVQLHAAVDRYRGVWGDIRVLGILKGGGRREYEAAVGGFSKEQRYTIYHRGAEPASP